MLCDDYFGLIGWVFLGRAITLVPLAFQQQNVKKLIKFEILTLTIFFELNFFFNFKIWSK